MCSSLFEQFWLVDISFEIWQVMGMIDSSEYSLPGKLYQNSINFFPAQITLG